MKLTGRIIHEGRAKGKALTTMMGISFFGGVDPATGIVVEKGHELEGMSVQGRILVFPTGKGSTVGSYTLYRLMKNGKAPAAIINSSCETITAVGCIISDIPCIDQIEIEKIPSGSSISLESNQIEINTEEAG
ncbi:MAG: DUF126 domain-containing protein [Anaerolineales bacterium]|nr:DUF126 domain-containing protein [Anaerolineales bacterium]